MKSTKKKATIKRHRRELSMVAHAYEEIEHDKDFFKWTCDQAQLLKKREFSKLDIDNLIEEIESLGQKEEP